MKNLVLKKVKKLKKPKRKIKSKNVKKRSIRRMHGVRKRSLY